MERVVVKTSSFSVVTVVALKELGEVVDASFIGVDVTMLVIVVSTVTFDDVISPSGVAVVVDTPSTGVLVCTTFSVVVSTSKGPVVDVPSS